MCMHGAWKIRTQYLVVKMSILPVRLFTCFLLLTKYSADTSFICWLMTSRASNTSPSSVTMEKQNVSCTI